MNEKFAIVRYNKSLAIGMYDRKCDMQYKKQFFYQFVGNC